jgi:molybdenum cofactor guanylyltransferase
MKPYASSPASFLKQEVTGIILAGGRAQRMGGADKGLVLLNGIPMVEHVITVLRREVDNLLINANRNLEQYAAFGYPVIPDMLGGFLGPLAGMASGMQAAKTKYIITVPCDSPLISDGLVRRLHEAMEREKADISTAHDGARTHPVFALIRCDLLTDLLDFLNAGERKIDRWYARHRLAIAHFIDKPKSFLNVNSPEERAELENLLVAGKTGNVE